MMLSQRIAQRGSETVAEINFSASDKSPDLFLFFVYLFTYTLFIHLFVYLLIYSFIYFPPFLSNCMKASVCFH